MVYLSLLTDKNCYLKSEFLFYIHFHYICVIIIHIYIHDGTYYPFSQTMRLPNGDEVTAPAPVWGLDIKCAKGTNLSYGPWADRQREQLFRFFFPQDYQILKVGECGGWQRESC